jgi:hypothetical protein
MGGALAIPIMSRTTAMGFAKPQPIDLLPDGPVDLPDGQISSRFDYPLSSPFRKNILIFRRRKSVYIRFRPVPLEGRLAIVTDAGRDAVDAAAFLTNCAEADGKAVWS